MKNFAIVGAAVALFAAPAAANAQAFIQAEAGADHVSVEGENRTGFGYGISGGYDYQLNGGLFIGVQGTFADSDTKQCYSEGEGYKSCVEAGRDVSAVVRLGTAAGEKSKVYVFGGYTNARVELTARSSELDGVYGLRTDLDGVRLGAGFQQDLNDKFFVKAEYRYSNYQNDVSRHAGVVALGAKF